MKAQVALELCEGPRPGSDSCPLTESSQDGRGKGVLWSPFYKGTNSVHEGFPLMT